MTATADRQMELTLPMVPDIEIARQPLDPSAAIQSLLKIAKEKAHPPAG